MKLLELALQVILQEHHEDFTDSLLAGGIDVEKQTWDHAAVMYNAKASADILSIYAQREGIHYLYTILDGLQRGEYRSVMVYIYLMSERRHWLPPYWMIQHAIDEKLLEEYCICLKEILPACIALLSAGKKVK